MLSHTVEYALRAMICLSNHGDAALNSQAIAAHTRVPPGYLSKIMRDLVVAELVASFRGPHGGFILARQPEQITILDVVNAVDPIARFRRCPIGHPEHTTLCALHQRLDDALAQIEQTFSQTTLAQVLGTECRRHGNGHPPAPETKP